MQRHSALARYAHAIALLIAIAVGAVQAETLHLDCSPAKADGFVLQDTLANYGELRVRMAMHWWIGAVEWIWRHTYTYPTSAPQEVSERAYVNMVLQEQYPSIPVGYETCPIGSEYTLTPYNACIKVSSAGVWVYTYQDDAPPPPRSSKRVACPTCTSSAFSLSSPAASTSSLAP